MGRTLQSLPDAFSLLELEARVSYECGGIIELTRVSLEGSDPPSVLLEKGPL